MNKSVSKILPQTPKQIKVDEYHVLPPLPNDDHDYSKTKKTIVKPKLVAPSQSIKKFPTINRNELEKEVIRQHKFGEKRWMLFSLFFCLIAIALFGFNWHIRLKLERMSKNLEIVQILVDEAKYEKTIQDKKILFLNKKITELEQTNNKSIIKESDFKESEN